MYTDFSADFYSIFQIIPIVYKVKNANILHDCYVMTTPKEAYDI